jgi:phospholipase/carboxylesterase
LGGQLNLIHTIYEPQGDGPHPAIIAFHGWGASGLDLLGLAPYLAQGKFLVLCPQGPMEVPIGAINGYGWFPIATGSPPDAKDIDQAVAQAERFVAAALERYPINPRKLVLLGFSQGGAMAYNLALRSPARFAALVGLSTWFPPYLAQRASDPDALERLPTMIQHGRTDEMIGIARARQSIEELRKLRVPLVYKEYNCGHEITADGIQDLSKFLQDNVLTSVIAL